MIILKYVKKLKYNFDSLTYFKIYVWSFMIKTGQFGLLIYFKNLVSLLTRRLINLVNATYFNLRKYIIIFIYKVAVTYISLSTKFS